jgi:hypothetical protein
MISKIRMRIDSGKLTEDDRDDESLDVLCTGLVGVSREIGNIETQGGVIAQDSVEIGEERPGED